MSNVAFHTSRSGPVASAGGRYRSGSCPRLRGFVTGSAFNGQGFRRVGKRLKNSLAVTDDPRFVDTGASGVVSADATAHEAALVGVDHQLVAIHGDAPQDHYHEGGLPVIADRAPGRCSGGGLWRAVDLVDLRRRGRGASRRRAKDAVAVRPVSHLHGRWGRWSRRCGGPRHPAGVCARPATTDPPGRH